MSSLAYNVRKWYMRLGWDLPEYHKLLSTKEKEVVTMVVNILLLAWTVDNNLSHLKRSTVQLNNGNLINTFS